MREGQYFNILCSISGSSIKYLARFHYLGLAFAILLNLSKNLNADGIVMLKSSVESIDCSI